MRNSNSTLFSFTLITVISTGSVVATGSSVAQTGVSVGSMEGVQVAQDVVVATDGEKDGPEAVESGVAVTDSGDALLVATSVADVVGVVFVAAIVGTVVAV